MIQYLTDTIGLIYSLHQSGWYMIDHWSTRQYLMGWAVNKLEG